MTPKKAPLPSQENTPKLQGIPKGLIIPVVVQNPQGPEGIGTKSGYGLIDTGASMTCISTPVAEELGLRIVRRTTMVLARGKSSKVPIFYVNVTISLPRNRITISQAVGGSGLRYIGQPGILALIGRDLLQYYRFKYDGPRNKIKKFREAVS